MNDKLLENAVKIAVEKDYKKEVTDFSERDSHTFPPCFRRKNAASSTSGISYSIPQTFKIPLSSRGNPRSSFRRNDRPRQSGYSGTYRKIF